MDTEIDDLRKIAISQALRIVNLEAQVKQGLNDRDTFKRWYHEERIKAAKLASEVDELKANLKRVLDIPGFDPNVRAVSERQQ